MIVLALDTALGACQAAVLQDDKVLAQMSQPMERGHQERLAPLVRETMAASGLSFSQLDRVAVVVGPGSFTGVRVGLAFAKGLSVALDIPCVGIGSLEALAAPVAGMAAAVIDAPRGQRYLQLFQDGEPLSEAEAILAEEEPARTAPHAVTRVGPAADGPAFPDIALVARLAAARPAPTTRPAPIYLRPPDAKTLAERGAGVTRLVALREVGYAALADLHAKSFDRPWSAEALETAAAGLGGIGLAAVEGQDLLGFVILRVVAGEAEVITIAVDPARRRLGVGKALMLAVAESAMAFGADEIFLEVAQDNPAALALYAGAGYEPVGRRPGYYPRRGGVVDAILLRARLNTASAVG